MPAKGEDSRDGEGHRYGKLANSQGNQGGDNAAKGQKQQREGQRNDEALGVLDVVLTGLAEVEVEGCLAGQFELNRRVAAMELGLK